MKKKLLKFYETLGIIIEMISWTTCFLFFVFLVYKSFKNQDYFFTIIFIIMLISITIVNVLYFKNKINNGFYDDKYSIKELNNRRRL